MSDERCPICSEVLGQDTYMVGDELVTFWLCPECGYETPVEDSPVGVTEKPEEK